MPEPKPESSGVPPKRPGKTAVGTQEASPKPSKEEIVAALKTMNQRDLFWIRRELSILLGYRGR